MKKKTTSSKKLSIRQLEKQLEKLEEKNEKAVDNLIRKIKNAMQLRVVEIDTRLRELSADNNLKITKHSLMQIKKLNSEKFDLECYIHGVC